MRSFKNLEGATDVPRSPEQYEAMRTATRERIRSAAMRLFAHQGFAAVNIRQISAEAGISIGLVYRHFATKEELYADLIAEASAGLAGTIERLRSPGPASPADRLRAFTDDLLQDVAGGGEAVDFYLLMNQVLIQAAGHGDSDADVLDAVRQLMDRHADLVATAVTLIERGQQGGLESDGFRPGRAQELASCYFALLSGLVTMRAALGERLEVPSPSAVLGVLLIDVTAEHTRERRP